MSLSLMPLVPPVIESFERGSIRVNRTHGRSAASVSGSDRVKFVSLTL